VALKTSANQYRSAHPSILFLCVVSIYISSGKLLFCVLF